MTSATTPAIHSSPRTVTEKTLMLFLLCLGGVWEKDGVRSGAKDGFILPRQTAASSFTPPFQKTHSLISTFSLSRSRRPRACLRSKKRPKCWLKMEQRIGERE